MILSDDATFCGISLYPRSRRRVLVVVAYAVSLAYVVAVAAAPMHISNAALAAFSVALMTLTHTLFGNVVRPLLRQQEKLHTQGAADLLIDEEVLEPDHYEAAVRSEAHNTAYKVVVVCFVIGAVPMAALMDHGARHFASYGIAFIVLMCILLVSLPQAAILWQQPDMAESK